MNFFLKKFPSTEWSGPAWYKPHFKKGEKFPQGFTLVHFHPVDLGHGTATTIEAGDTAKILSKTWKDYPETEKCMMGIIHSHHTMGAFFSGTDKNCLHDNAPIKNFYCSTVVASAKDRFVFGCTYKDQYGITHLVESEKGNIKVDMPPDTEEPKWKAIAKKIEKQKKSNTSIQGFTRGGRTQMNMFGSYAGYGNPYGYKPVHDISGNTTGENPDEKHILKIRDEAETEAVRDGLLHEADVDMIYLGKLHEEYTQGNILMETYRDEVVYHGYDPNIFMKEIGKEKDDVKYLPEKASS